MSLSGPGLEKICAICGSNTTATTAAGDLGCLSCLLRMGAEDDSGSTAPMMDRVPDALGAYVITRHEDGSPHELGRGAMGITFLAEDVSLQRLVALKIIKADFGQGGSDARERFMREARAAAALRHPNVATVYQFGMDDETGQYFYAMELVEGETLEERVRRTGPLNFPTVIEIARQVTAALTAAENRGLVHRDLKPGNIMIATGKEEDRITVKVIDFGVAKALHAAPDARHLTSGGFVGTPAFASPEQLRGRPVDTRSDIYSLGATLWFSLTGKMPFPDQHEQEENENAERPPPHPEELKAARVPGRFSSLLLAMLAAEPAARPGTGHLGAKLEKIAHSRARPVLLGLACLVLPGLVFGYYLYSGNLPPKRDTAALSKSIAVLPFDNLSDEKGGANFADGVQDELLTNLARIADLKVVSRTSAMQYRRGSAPRSLRDIGQQLGVAYVVEGTVRTIGRQVRISVQLIDAHTDLHQWAENYDRPLDDVFAIQSEIAQAIAERLHAVISPPERALLQGQPTRDLEAFNLYSRAKTIFGKALDNLEGCPPLTEAATLLDQAVARDPHFALAYCELANVHSSLYFQGCDHTPKRL